MRKPLSAPLQMDGNTLHDLDAVGELLLALHKLPQQVEFISFQEQALALLSKTLPFDSAWWGLVSGLNIHTDIKYRLPPTYHEDWEKVKVEDPIATRTIETPFSTVRFNEQNLSLYPILQAMLARYGIRHVLCTHTAEPSLGLNAFLSIYRSDAPFTEEERVLKQMVMPHMIHALHLSWRKHLESALLDASWEDQLVANAICDESGLILSAEGLFGRFMSMEWPRWHGPMLQEGLLANLRTGRSFQGKKIRIVFRDVSGLFLVRVSERKLISELSPRELSVAERYAFGKTYKAIALELDLTPNTVRHYIRTVFGKLQIRNKAELSRLVFRATPECR